MGTLECHMKELTFHITKDGFLMFSEDSDDDCCWWYCHFQANGTAVSRKKPSLNVSGHSQLGIDLICRQFQENYI